MSRDSLADETTHPAPVWIYRKMLLGDFLIYQPKPEDPDDITNVVDLGEIRDEKQAAAIVARLNGQQRPVWAEGQAQREVAMSNGALLSALWAWVDAEVDYYAVYLDPRSKARPDAHFRADAASETFRQTFMAQVARRAAEREAR